MIGLGVSSYSHFDGVNFQNAHNFEEYVRILDNDKLPLLRAVSLTPKQQLIREMILQLKTGSLDTAYFRNKFAVDVWQEFRPVYERLREEKLLERDHLIVRRHSEAQTREFDARPSIVALEPGDEDGHTVLEAMIRFTARAQVRPDELVSLLVPEADARGVDVERVRLWTERCGRRLDPLELLSART